MRASTFLEFLEKVQGDDFTLHPKQMNVIDEIMKIRETSPLQACCMKVVVSNGARQDVIAAISEGLHAQFLIIDDIQGVDDMNNEVPENHEKILNVINDPAREAAFRKMYLNEMPQTPAMIYIFARDYKTASLYCRQNNISPKEWRYISDENSLQGVSDVEIRLITTHLQNPRYWEIMEEIRRLEGLKRAVVKKVDW